MIGNEGLFHQHKNVALSFSGGKDSLACVYLMREHLPNLTVYHMDPGDMLPETKAVVAHVKTMAARFVHLHGDVHSWQERHGLPTDLVPHTAHPMGQLMQGVGPKLVSRYDCCRENLMRPVWDAIRADGVTLVIRGSKRSDPASKGNQDGMSADGVTLCLPIWDWSDADVFAYLAEQGAPISRVYQEGATTPDCATCSGWWEEKRAAYLRKHHPELWAVYGAKLKVVTDAIREPIAQLEREIATFD